MPDAHLRPKALAVAYDALIADGRLEDDPAQRALVERLDMLRVQMAEAGLASKSSALGWMFSKRRKPEAVKGLYIWGSVGRGKSMLMDLFFANTNAFSKRRVHFNEFMGDVHERIHAHRQGLKDGTREGDDPIPPVATALADEARLLCFDEFTVTDIADAMIMSRLFKALFEKGVVVVATSNVAPDDLYHEGLNRNLFLPFIDVLKAHVDEFELDARTDYRLEKLGAAPVYLTPFGTKTDLAMQEAWQRLAGEGPFEREQIEVKGRSVTVPKSTDGIAWFNFDDICGKPLGANDYLAIARRYHTIFIDRVPIMGLPQRNEAKRFILLIDTLYDMRRKLVISAEASPHALYQARTGREAFEFDRTISRLIEMQSEDYLAGVVAEKAI